METSAVMITAPESCGAIGTADPMATKAASSTAEHVFRIASHAATFMQCLYGPSKYGRMVPAGVAERPPVAYQVLRLCCTKFGILRMHNSSTKFSTYIIVDIILEYY